MGFELKLNPSLDETKSVNNTEIDIVDYIHINILHYPFYILKMYVKRCMVHASFIGLVFHFKND